MDPREYQIAVRGGRQREMTLGDMVFECPACGWRADRDYNASLNMLRRAGWEPPVALVEFHPLPVALGRGQGGQ
jgi:putative transposase